MLANSRTLEILQQKVVSGKITVQTAGKQGKMVEFFDEGGWLGRAGRTDFDHAVANKWIELVTPLSRGATSIVRLITSEKNPVAFVPRKKKSSFEEVDAALRARRHQEQRKLSNYTYAAEEQKVLRRHGWQKWEYEAARDDIVAAREKGAALGTLQATRARYDMADLYAARVVKFMKELGWSEHAAVAAVQSAEGVVRRAHRDGVPASQMARSLIGG